MEILPLDYIKLLTDRFSELGDKTEVWELLFVILDEYISFRSQDFFNYFVQILCPLLLESFKAIPIDQLLNPVNSLELAYLTYKEQFPLETLTAMLLGLDNVMKELSEEDREMNHALLLQLLNRLILEDDRFINSCIHDKPKLEWMLSNLLKASRYPLDYCVARGYVLSVMKLYYLFKNTVELVQYKNYLLGEKQFVYFFGKVESVVQRLNQLDPIEHWLYNPEELSAENIINEEPVNSIKAVKRQKVSVK